MPRTKKPKEEVVSVLPIENQYNIDSSYVSISGEIVNFKARNFVPISEITIVCENIASAVAAEDGYHPYLEEFLVWTALVNLYTDIEINTMIEQDSDLWYKELVCSNLKDVLTGIISQGQYKLIVESVHNLIMYTIRNKKSSLDTLIDYLIGDGVLLDLLENAVPSETKPMEGEEANVKLS